MVGEMGPFNSVTYWHWIAMHCYLKTCIFASVRDLSSPYPSADLCAPLPGQVQISFLQILTEVNPELKILRMGLVLGDCQLEWYVEDIRFDIYLPYMSLGLKNHSWPMTAKHGSSMHIGILYISLSLPFCENFEKGLEREQDEYFSLVNHSSISISLSELLF